MTLPWQPAATINDLQKRAQIIAKIRNFFNQRGYLEVETPVMAKHGVTDIYLENIKATFRNQVYYLQTSPEYHMKRLLAAGSGPIFQLAKVFRDDELGRWHNPEFSMLEWYQLGIDHLSLMDEVDDLLQSILQATSMKRMAYQEVFLQFCNLDPFSVTLDCLKKATYRFNLQNIIPEDEQDKDQYLFLLLSHIIEPELAKESVPVAIYNFPPSQAALAQINQGVAERFEVYYQGIELANGFHELTDAKAQHLRFRNDMKARKARGLNTKIIPDQYLLSALEKGLPACSGVALGIDRLITLALGYDDISKSMAFPIASA